MSIINSINLLSLDLSTGLSPGSQVLPAMASERAQRGFAGARVNQIRRQAKRRLA